MRGLVGNEAHPPCEAEGAPLPTLELAQSVTVAVDAPVGIDGLEAAPMSAPAFSNESCARWTAAPMSGSEPSS